MNYWTMLALMFGAISLALWGVAIGVGLFVWRRLRPTAQAISATAAALSMLGTMNAGADE